MKSEHESLLQLLAPPQSPVENEGDWGQAEKQLGTSLPDDYKWFIGVYGTGFICDGLVKVLTPFATIKALNILDCDGTLEWFRQEREQSEKPLNPFPVYPESGGILPWGTSKLGHDLFWLTRGEPNEWDVVFHDRTRIEFRHYEKTSMTQFLSAWLSVSLDDGRFKLSEQTLKDLPLFKTPGEQAIRDEKKRQERKRK